MDCKLIRFLTIAAHLINGERHQAPIRFCCLQSISQAWQPEAFWGGVKELVAWHSSMKIPSNVLLEAFSCLTIPGTSFDIHLFASSDLSLKPLLAFRRYTCKLMLLIAEHT